jgi:hypothetical protein
MKCHACDQELVRDLEYNAQEIYWACPSLHILTVVLDEAGNITQYRIYCDDIEKDSRYRLKSNRYRTCLQHRSLKQKEIQGPRWSTVMEFDGFMPLNIREDRIQIDNLVHRLLKLRAFS